MYDSSKSLKNPNEWNFLGNSDGARCQFVDYFSLTNQIIDRLSLENSYVTSRYSIIINTKSQFWKYPLGLHNEIPCNASEVNREGFQETSLTIRPFHQDASKSALRINMFLCFYESQSEPVITAWTSVVTPETGCATSKESDIRFMLPKCKQI